MYDLPKQLLGKILLLASIKSDAELFNEIKEVCERLEREEKAKGGREKITPLVNYDKILLEIPV